LSAGLLVARLPQCSAKLPTRLSSFSYFYQHPLSKQLFARGVFCKAAYNTFITPKSRGWSTLVQFAGYHMTFTFLRNDVPLDVRHNCPQRRMFLFCAPILASNERRNKKKLSVWENVAKGPWFFNDWFRKTTVRGTMEVGKNSVIYMGLISGPNKAEDTCGKTTVTRTMDRGSTVLYPLTCPTRRKIVLRLLV
jgi:hypothetical protein